MEGQSTVHVNSGNVNVQGSDVYNKAPGVHVISSTVPNVVQQPPPQENQVVYIQSPSVYHGGTIIYQVCMSNITSKQALLQYISNKPHIYIII